VLCFLLAAVVVAALLLPEDLGCFLLLPLVPLDLVDGAEPSSADVAREATLRLLPMIRGMYRG
jgi:hypothetical protein